METTQAKCPFKISTLFRIEYGSSSLCLHISIIFIFIVTFIFAFAFMFIFISEFCIVSFILGSYFPRLCRKYMLVYFQYTL